MNILVAVEELRVGGAQTFALRLAQALHEAGHRVYLYAIYWQLVELELAARLAPYVEVLVYKPAVPRLDLLVQRAEGWLERRGCRLTWRDRHLRRCLQEHGIEVVSSNTFKSDELMAHALLGKDFAHVPLTIIMHGDYEQFWAFYQRGQDYVLPDYPARLRATLARVTAVAYLAEQNLQVLAPAIVPAAATDQLLVRRIYNGLEARFSLERERYSRAALNIEPGAFVVGMVARGVPEKGWRPLLAACEMLRRDPALAGRPVHAMLVGSSPFLDELREQY